MSKAQTDIRTTSYDAASARPHGYQGLIDDVVAQIKAEPDAPHQGLQGREELLHYLGVDKVPTTLAVPEDDSVEYGAPAQEKMGFSLPHAIEKGWIPKSIGVGQLSKRFDALTDQQMEIYWIARKQHGVRHALAIANAYPYPAVLS